MSDVTITPAAPEPATPANEVAINPSPVNTPTPVGQQAPDRIDADYKGSEHRPKSRREAIQEAFDRASKSPDAKPKSEPRAPAKVAEAKPGHNKPPEETEKLDLKKRPGDQPRGDRGQFAPRARAEGTPGHAQDAQNAQNAQTDANRNAALRPAPLPEGTPYRDPPPRFSDSGKAEWAAAPESVRADVHRMHQEFGKAYQHYRGAAEAMQPIARFHQMAQQQGTTLERALTNYVSMEHKLRSDIIGGLDAIVNNIGMQIPDGQGGTRRADLRDIAYTVLSQSPDQHKMVQNQNAQTAASHQIGALHQEITALKGHLQQMHTRQQFTYTRSAVDQFAEGHPRFDELGDLIEGELRLGFDLDTAYRRAELLRPTTQAAQTRTASAQTRSIDRSISGSPASAPSNGDARRGPAPGRREAISNAIKSVRGGL